MSAKELFDLTGRVALVTGAASGIGLSISEVLAENGAHVVMTDIDAESLQIAHESLGSRGLNVTHAQLDVTQSALVSDIFDRVVERFGRIDIVCANAGISSGPGPRSEKGQIANLDLNSWDMVLSVNLTGVMNTVRAAAGHMIARKAGRILVTASMAGLGGDPNCGYAYAATKGGVANLVKQVAIEMGQHNVNVNAIAPGPFLTNIGNGRLSETSVSQGFAERTLLGRIADPSEIKGLALLLCSDASSYITGAVVPIDGGTLGSVDKRASQIGL